MSVAVLVLEGQLIVTLTVLLVAAWVTRVQSDDDGVELNLICITTVAGVVVAGVVVARVVVAGIVVAGVVVAGVSTITATVIARPTAQEVTKTEESDPDLILPWSLASPPPATVTTSSSSTEEAKQTSVGIVSLGLSLPTTEIQNIASISLVSHVSCLMSHVSCLMSHLLPQGLLFPPPRAPPSKAPPTSPAPTPRIPPSTSSLPELMKRVSVFVCWAPELLEDEEEDPPNFSCDRPRPNVRIMTGKLLMMSAQN